MIYEKSFYFLYNYQTDYRYECVSGFDDYVETIQVVKNQLIIYD